ncbi:MAG: anthranilate synthase component 1 [Alphaproteobacteria bacterium]|nr:MAG: anthranilate synthase component 1 [Alphaproteobacteria bacterium]
MSAQQLIGGTARALTRRLSRTSDRLALYAALTDGGRRTDTLMIETLAGPSLIVEQAAVRIECRGQEATLTALTANGRNVLPAVATSLAHVVTEQAPSLLRLTFPRTKSEDAETRLLAPSPFDALRAVTAGIRSETPEEPFTLALAGTVAFDHVDLFEDLPAPPEDALGFPDFVFWLAESLIVVEPGLAPRLVCTAFGSDSADAEAHNDAADRLAALAERCEQPVPPVEPPVAQATPLEPETDLDDAAYCDVVRRMKAHILAGDVYQIVPSRTFRRPCADPLAAFAAVRRLDRSPYMFFVSAPDHFLFGASPETSVRIVREKDWPMVEVKPIAGTRPRGADPDEDDRMEADLRLDQKEIAEHMMLVDLARNDVARVSMPGTRRVANLMTVERYARVMHLVSSVKGSLAIGFDALHALQACLNVGTLSGAPKLRATELLRLTERTKRGPYGGAIGWLNGVGAMDSGVVIRSAVVKDGVAYVRAGAGVVHDSDPQAEADETRRKASAILSAIASVEGV